MRCLAGMLGFYARATAWLSVPRLERRIALLALLLTLPSLAIGLEADDYLLHEQVTKDGPFAGYLFTPRGSEASHEQQLERRSSGVMPWWVEEHPRFRFFRPLTSLSLWLDFAHGAPPWWMHLENCVLYAAIVWLAAAIYRQLGLSGASLGWAALFFALDMGFAGPVGWLAARNTLMAACFGFACILLHVHARRSGRPALLALACVCFALSLLSGELGVCTLGFLSAHALFVDRAPPLRRVLALSPYAALVALYLAHYVSAGYGVSGGEIHRNVVAAPGAALLAFIESIPVWLATTATLPFASLLLMVPDVRVPIVVGSVVILALLSPLARACLREQPETRVLGAGALLSLVPLATVLPQERLRFFLALGVYGLLGACVVRDFDARDRLRRIGARAVWRIHGVWLPLFFIPSLFGVGRVAFSGGGANALDRALPHATSPITILLNAPSWYAPWFQAAMRATRNEPRPPVFTLYAGGQSLEIERIDARTLELRAARSWFTTPFERARDLERSPFHAGDRIELPHFTVEVRAVDESGAPTRTRFTFDRSLDDPALELLSWNRKTIAPWTPPPPGSRSQLPAASVL